MQTLQPLRFAALAFFLLCATAAPAAADGDLATVYARYVASLYVDASDFEAAAQRVDGYAASLNASSCRWPDINYHDPSRAEYVRGREGRRGWRTPPPCAGDTMPPEACGATATQRSREGGEAASGAASKAGGPRRAGEGAG